MLEVQENKMGTMSEGRLLFVISFPIMISMLIQALYNIVDSYFVGKISEEAFTALSIAFPLQNLMIGIAVGTGVGMNSSLSRYLGQKDLDKTNMAAENGVFLALIYGAVFFVLSFFLPKIYYQAQSNDPQIVEYGIEYLSIIMRFSGVLYFQIIMERILSSTGQTFFTMLAQSVGAITNIVLDPIFIFGLFGLPAMGVKGAAIATICGQTVGAICGWIFNKRFNPEVVIQKIRPRLDMIKRIYVVGIPSIIMMTITSVTIYFLNKILYRFSSAAVAALGAHFKLQSFVFMPIFGLTNGMVPIIAYNYGARHEQRIKKTIKVAMISAVIIMFFGVLVFHLATEELLDIFSASSEMLRIGVPALRIISLSFVPAGISIVGGSVFQALGNGILSLIDAILRQIVVLLPFAYFFSLTGNVDNVWWGYLVAEIGSIIFVAYYMKHFAYKKINRLGSKTV